MNLRQLQTLSAFLEHGSFAATGDAVGLSHPAVSVQMQQLEEDLGVALFDRTSRPAILTAEGMHIAQMGRDVLAQVEKIRQVAKGTQIAGSVSIGFVPTTVQRLLPLVLKALQLQYPDLQVSVKSGLSGELASAVLRRELDFAIVTSPIAKEPELVVTQIALEPLYVIGPAAQKGILDDAALARSMPFIAFSKKTWLGQQIAARLQSRGIIIAETMEVDNLDAIETLVSEGFGVSVVPQRLLARPLSKKLVRIPFCRPVETRKLVLIHHDSGQRAALEKAIASIVVGFARKTPAVRQKAPRNRPRDR
jgi:DNA-binding transcriptional LysR family regulator